MPNGRSESIRWLPAAASPHGGSEPNLFARQSAANVWLSHDVRLIAIDCSQVCWCFMRADAKSMIAEHLYNAAIPSLPLIVRIRHPRQFFAKLRKNGQASIHCRELLSSDLMGGRTIFGRLFSQSHQIRDVIEPEPQFPRMAQESEPFERGVIISPLPTFCARR